MPVSLDKISLLLPPAREVDPMSPWSERVSVDYASGSHHRGEIEGLAAAGIPIGVSAVVELKPDSVEALLDLAGTGLPVFLDSGAFAEIDRDGSVKKPITHARWKAKLRLYLRLGKALGPQLSVVAPDRVGDQKETLARLARYAPEIREIAATGARVLVPVQPGPLSYEQFFAAQQRAVGLPMVPALPMSRKVGATPRGVTRFLLRTGVSEVHLLGIGGRSSALPSIVDAIDAACPRCRITMDSNKLLALRGRTGGRGDPRATRPALYYGSGWGDPVLEAGADIRKLDTVMTDQATADLEEVAWEGEYTDLIGTPSEWLSRSRLLEVGGWIGLSDADLLSFADDPEAWLQEDERWSWPHVAGALDRAWTRYHFEGSGVERKKRATEATMRSLMGPLRGRPEQARVGLVACTNTKMSHPAAAADLYSPSALFSGARRWMETSGIPWFVLSARHGLLPTDQVIAPYKERLPSGKGPAKISARRPWARKVVQQLHDQIGPLQGIVFEMHTGYDYATPLVRLLEGQGAIVEQPLQGLQIGERLSWYKNH